MPAFNLTKDLFVESKIDQRLFKSLKDLIKEGCRLQSELRALVEILEADNARQQIEQLKKILQSLREKIQPADTELRLALQFIVHIFYISTSKNPVRRVLISYFQSISVPNQQDVIKSALERSLLTVLKQPVSFKQDSDQPIRGGDDSFREPIKSAGDLNQPVKFEDNYYVRHDVDTLSALLENFPLGEACLKSHCVEAMDYLGKALHCFYHNHSDQLSPVQQNETMHNCLETVKLANRICQKSSLVMETKVRDTKNIPEIRRVSKQLINVDICILKAEEFLLDCRTTTAMNVALWLKTFYVQRDRQLVTHLWQKVFKENQSCSSYDESVCDWSADFCRSQSEETYLFDSFFLPMLSQLKTSLLTDSAFLCLCYGILAMLPTDTLLMRFEGHRCILLDSLLPEFLALNTRCKDVGTKLLAAKSLCLLTQKLSQYVKNNRETCSPELLSRLHGESEEMKLVLDYIWTSWEDSVDAIRFTVKDTFEHVVAVHLNSLQTVTQPNDDEFLQNLTKSIISEVSWSCKGKYGTLAVLAGHLGSTRMLELHSGIAVDVLEQLKEQTLACYASDLYEKLFLSHMTELSSLDSDWLSSWLSYWVDPVLNVLCGDNKTQKKHIVEYILPKLLKPGSATLHYIVDQLSAGSLHEDTDVGIRGQQLGAMIICLRRARALGQLQGLSNRAEKRLEKEKKIKTRKGGKKIENAESLQEKNQSELAMKNNQSEKDNDNHQSKMKGDDQSNNYTQGDSQSDLWYGVVDVDVLRQALSSRDDQVRLDAFALLCENQKTTEVVSDLELDLIKGFIPYNLNNQMPSFRQHFLSHLKKLLTRMKESFAVLKRTYISSTSTEAAHNLKRYKDFLVWLKQCLFCGLFPGSTFARRTTCLGGLVLLIEIYGQPAGEGSVKVEEFIFFKAITGCDIQKILHCLTDTFEDNKREASEILISCSTYCSSEGILTEANSKDLFKAAMTLSCSSRPQDSTTAAYLLKVLLHQPHILKIINETGTRQNRKFEESANEAFHGHNEADVQSEAFGTKQLADTKKEISELEINHSTEQKHSQVNFQQKTDTPCSKNSETDRRLLLLGVLLSSLKEQVVIAQNSLIHAAANCPLYPTLQCMRYSLADINFRSIPSIQHSAWKQFLSEFITLCLKISEIVSPVVHNSSPEGNIPVAALKGTNLTIVDPNQLHMETDQSESGKHKTDQSEDRMSKSHETVMLMPEYLVVCCWRSVKEISLILGQLTKDVPIATSDEDSAGLLTHKQVLDIGSYFTTQLLESKHRGAFELAYAGFVKVTEMLWRSSVADLHKLPRQWLKDVMHDIRSGDPESRLCATRRSAGVPFYVQALVTTEPSTTGRLCFKETMSELLALAFDESLNTMESSTSKVHALNILRAMFKDTRLGDDVTPYIADGLKVAVLGFKSPLWAVRNSATLLLSAMMVRIFGVKRSKDETSLSRKNCQTGRTFFHRYPSLYQFLLNQLAESTVVMETGDNFHLHPALYPILMVLGHLFPSAMEGTDTTLNLMAFIPYVMKCSHSPVLKTRVMAARALQPLVDKDHVIIVFDDLLTQLPSNLSMDWKQNHVHGILLQMKQLLKIVPTLPVTVQQELSLKIIPKWTKVCDLLISSVNPCLLTRKEAMEISCDICSHLGCHGKETDITNHMTSDITSHMIKLLSGEISMLGRCNFRNYPGFTEFETTVCKLSLQFLQKMPPLELPEFHLTVIGRMSDKKEGMDGETDDQKFDVSDHVCQRANAERIVLTFLKSSSYEVQKCVLEFIKYCLLQRKVAALQKEESEEFAQWDCVLAESELEYIYEVIKWSSEIYSELVTMATEKDLHHGCLTEVLTLLLYHPLTQGEGHMVEYSTEKLLEKIIDKERSQTRDEVLSALIGYSGCLIGKLVEGISTLKSNQLDTPAIHVQTQKKLDLIEKWALVIQSNCGTEQNSDKQLACVKAIAQNADFLLCDCKNSLGSLTFTFWKIVLDLVQEDDLEVKDTAAGILTRVDSSLKASLHSYLALDLMIGQLLCHHGNSKIVESISFLIGLIAQDTEDSEEFEERLFDRGEMNTYREPIDFIKMVDKHLLRLLKGEYSEKATLNAFHTKETSTCIDQVKFLKELLNIEETNYLTVSFQRILPTVDGLVSDLSSINAKSMFLDTNSFNRRVLNLHRALTLVKYGLLLPIKEECKNSFVDIWRKLQDTLTENKYILEITTDLIADIELLAEVVL